MDQMHDIIRNHRPSHAEALALAEISDTAQLVGAAGRLRDLGHGNLISYSRKVFIPDASVPRRVPLLHVCAPAAQR